MPSTRCGMLRTIFLAVSSLALVATSAATSVYTPTSLTYPQCTYNAFGGTTGAPWAFYTPTDNLLASNRSYTSDGSSVIMAYGATILINTTGLACDSTHFSIGLYSAMNFNTAQTNQFTPVATTADTVVYSSQGANQILYIPFTSTLTLQPTTGLSYHLLAGFSNSKAVVYTNSPVNDRGAQIESYQYNITQTMPSTFTTSNFFKNLAVDLVTCPFIATTLKPKPDTCTTTNNQLVTSVIGDPQFVGLLGQSYQVHGMDDTVYNLISDRSVQVNSRFVFLSHGHCLRDGEGRPLYTCWSHAGSYLQSIALQTADGDRLLLVSGKAAAGFSDVKLGGAQLSVGDEVTGRDGKLTITFTSLRSITIANAGLWTMTLENSDGFLNIVSLSVSNWAKLVSVVKPHGLIGQTWRRDQKGDEVKQVEGRVDDYAEKTNDLFGCDVLYNRFACSK